MQRSAPSHQCGRTPTTSQALTTPAVRLRRTDRTPEPWEPAHRIGLLCTTTRPGGCGSHECDGQSVPEASRLSVDPDQKVCDRVPASAGDEDESCGTDRLISCASGLLITANPCIARDGKERAKVFPCGRGLEAAVRPGHVDLFEDQRPNETVSLLELPTFIDHVFPFPGAKGTPAPRIAGEFTVADMADAPGPAGAATGGVLVGGTR
ncbi:hypothetical protein KPATCC21470_8606 [Kitasatospora purpeofusca]